MSYYLTNSLLKFYQKQTVHRKQQRIHKGGFDCIRNVCFKKIKSRLELCHLSVRVTRSLGLHSCSALFLPSSGLLIGFLPKGCQVGLCGSFSNSPKIKIIGKWGSPALRLCSSVLFFRALIEDESSVTCVPGLNSEAAAEAPASQPASQPPGTAGCQLQSWEDRPRSGAPTRAHPPGNLPVAALRG